MHTVEAEVLELRVALVEEVFLLCGAAQCCDQHPTSTRYSEVRAQRGLLDADAFASLQVVLLGSSMLATVIMCGCGGWAPSVSATKIPA